MKEEGFVCRALANVTPDTGRWLASQNMFNGFDTDLIDARTKAAVIVALDIFNQTSLPNRLEPQIERALNASTLGEIKQIIAEVTALLP